MFGLHRRGTIALYTLLAFCATATALAAPTTPRSAAARALYAGTLHRGERVLVEEVTHLPDGPGLFARVSGARDTGEAAAWLQVPAGLTLEAGDDFAASEEFALYREPFAEEDSPAESSAAMLGVGGFNSLLPMDPKRVPISRECTRFIRADGQFGDWGDFLMGHISRDKHPNFFRDDLEDLSRVCPRFSRMNDTEKKNFWVWLIAAVAHSESSCRESLKARGKNGTVAGLMQMHYRKEHIYGCARGTNSLRARDNLTCAMHILNKDLKRTSRIFPTKKNYWSTLRPQRRGGIRTWRIVKEYKPCF